MKAAEVIIGKVYAAKVSGKIAPVRILVNRGKGGGWTSAFGSRTSNYRHLGFTGKNENTGREVRVTAAKLRCEMGRTNGKWHRLFYSNSPAETSPDPLCHVKELLASNPQGELHAATIETVLENQKRCNNA